jgi:DNA-dependent RNA polymerase auxiliary subunit epsilon
MSYSQEQDNREFVKQFTDELYFNIQTSRKLKKSVRHSVRQDVKICRTKTNSVGPKHVTHKIRRHFDCRVPKSTK